MSEPAKSGSFVAKDTLPDDVSGARARHSQAPPLEPPIPTQQQADSTNDEMARQMEQRRLSRPERRSGTSVAAVPDRRRVCAYCFQPGDHPTPAHCLRALER